MTAYRLRAVRRLFPIVQLGLPIFAGRPDNWRGYRLILSCGHVLYRPRRPAGRVRCHRCALG